MIAIAVRIGRLNIAPNDLGPGTLPSNHGIRIDRKFHDRDDQSIPVGVMASLTKTAGKKTTTGIMPTV
ncbi:hypothetical protein BMF89_05665 [Arthrobacter sp. SRS-W-1-2016]|jgi:hypothetical protein|uniref:hypothetical protein n=1 Tax=Arthrobacter sp. SRS-W-1-2016 TaxID=1930254 RepID=UPI0009910799|nr:hypothetical protein [Arthrobacter sp. SRS-W-1-2016]OOP63764.1 hypothetical protein BMF89_05665 [Arthrobacter sp. SRS-W-1-2016]